MKNNVYIGNRYVPVFANPVEWNNLREYEPLTIVTYQGTAYTSRKTVPVGTALSNTDYWVVTGNYNAQVESYRQEVAELDDDVTTLSGNVTSLATTVNRMLNHKYIFVGDSYANGSGSNNGWIARLVNMLGIASGDYYQTSMGGIGFTTTTNNFLGILTALSSSISDKASITDIVVCGGANDLSQAESTVVTNIQSFIDYCHLNYPNAIIHIGDCAGTSDVTRIGSQYARVARGYQWGSYGKNVHFLRNLPYVFKNIGRTFAVNALQNAVDLIIILNIKMRKIRTATVTQYGVIRGFINSLKGILWRFLAFLLSLFPSFFSSASVVFLPVSAVSFLSTFSSPVLGLFLFSRFATALFAASSLFEIRLLFETLISCFLPSGIICTIFR